MNEVSLKPVIDELETLFSKFNKAFFEGKLEKPVITVSPDHTRGLMVGVPLGRLGKTAPRKAAITKSTCAPNT
jgi:hypothetical protein